MYIVFFFLMDLIEMTFYYRALQSYLLKIHEVHEHISAQSFRWPGMQSMQQ